MFCLPSQVNVYYMYMFVLLFISQIVGFMVMSILSSILCIFLLAISASGVDADKGTWTSYYYNFSQNDSTVIFV